MSERTSFFQQCNSRSFTSLSFSSLPKLENFTFRDPVIKSLHIKVRVELMAEKEPVKMTVIKIIQFLSKTVHSQIVLVHLYGLNLFLVSSHKKQLFSKSLCQKKKQNRKVNREESFTLNNFSILILYFLKDVCSEA